MSDSRIWNQNGEFVGMKADPGNVKDGNLGEIHVDHENQGVYTLFSANNDAICVAWATTTWSDNRGGNQYAVMGDMGYICNQPWYWSGMYPNSNEDWGSKPEAEQPKCFWIDKDGDQPSTGFQVRWPAFSSAEVDPDAPPEERDPKKKCDDISFGIRTEPDPNSIWLKPERKGRRGLGSQTAKTKPRRHVRRNDAMKSQLIVGDAGGQSARFLCDSDTSVGPDFVNTNEGVFCDMGSKKVYDICHSRSQSSCFDVESKMLLPASNATVASFRTRQVQSPYDTVIDWRGQGTSK